MALACSLAQLTPAQSSAIQTPPQMSKDERMQWWRQARFGMFIHFGIYSPAGGEWDGKDWPGAAEWLLVNAKADPLEYRKKLLPQFNPTKFVAAEWAQIAKDAGMQYVVITTKHHDGFCLWDSALTDYDVMNSPFKRDIMKELSDAVRAGGMHMGWYHSIMDWTHPDYLPRREWDKRATDAASYPRYVEYMHGQLKELLTRYGKIDVLWFDGEWEGTWNHDWGKKTDDWVRSLQPQIIVNNRVDSGRAGLEGFSTSEEARGDFGTPEQTIPANGMPGKDWETCMTMNDTWGFKLSDKDWKSTRTLIHNLCDIASKGGNFLLNVGPRGDGTIPPESVERLKAMGAWLRVNGEAIYGTSASPFTRPFPWGRVTRKDNTLYLLILNWPADGVLRLPGLETEVKSAGFLDPNAHVESVRFTSKDGGVQIGVPMTSPLPGADAIVMELTLAGPPKVAPTFIQSSADGRIICTAADANSSGSIRYEERFKNLGFWYDPRSTAWWDVKSSMPKRCAVTVDYSSPPGCAGEVEVAVGETKLRAVLPARKGWDDFASFSVGEADIPGNKPFTVRVASLTKPGEAFVNLRSVTLYPLPVPQR